MPRSHQNLMAKSKFDLISFANTSYDFIFSGSMIPERFFRPASRLLGMRNPRDCDF
jgi:hypothetical protein